MQDKKIFVTSGCPYSNGQNTEVIDLKVPTFDCKLPPYPIEMSNGAGGVIKGNKILICGGFNGTQIGDCYSLGQNKTWTKTESLQTPRSAMSTGNVVVNGSVWISGGYNGSYLNSNLWMNEQSATTESTNLPLAGNPHCSVLVRENQIMIIGGRSGESRRKTHFLNLDKHQWSSGPMLNRARALYNCAKVEIGGSNFIFVAGGWNYWVEYLNIDDINGTWKNGDETNISKVLKQSVSCLFLILGIDLATGLDDHRMVTSEDGKELFIIGGSRRRHVRNQVLKLHCEGTDPATCSFKEIETKLKFAREEHIALPISDSFARQLCT